jgi:hypothetical protein
MEDVTSIRETARGLLTRPQDENAVRAAAELLRLAAEIDRQTADGQKSQVEARKLEHDLDQSRRTQRSNDRKAYIALLAPVFTTLILAFTLGFQYYQFRESEIARTAESERQSQAAEELRWEEAVKLVSQTESLSGVVLFAQTWGTKPRYAERARGTTKILLSRPQEFNTFASLFNAVYEPISLDNIKDVVEIDRALESLYGPTPLFRLTDLQELSSDQRKNALILVNSQLDFISAKMSTFLKQPRSPTTVIDLSDVNLSDCDLQSVDFKGVNIARIFLLGDILKGAELTGYAELPSFDRVNFARTPWWEAKEIDARLLAYLKSNYPYTTKYLYPSTQSPSSYEAGLRRLEGR